MANKNLLAHSARFGCPEQLYEKHISNVVNKALENAKKVSEYMPLENRDSFLTTVRASAVCHDLGKIDEANQKILSGEAQGRLPLDHSDAGTAYLLEKGAIPSAICVFAHHAGLPSILEEKVKKYPFRSNKSAEFYNNKTAREITDEKLNDYLEKHETAMDCQPEIKGGTCPRSSFLRFALSCLVDADHGDTANHYRRGRHVINNSLRSIDRVSLLDAYVNKLQLDAFKNSANPERLQIRQEFYSACRKKPKDRGIYSCSMPVGTGKTTSIIAHLLMASDSFRLRRIFVVLPFTNIIDQSVKTYRKSIVMDDEDPETVVAAHHHQAEFKNPLLMESSFLWDAPVTVTTAVQFFETLAANRPTALRKFHNLAGSAIFIDEAHAALPPHLWPQAWKWLQSLVDDWGCHIVMGSGSLSHFWKLQEFSETELIIPEITGDELYQKAARMEEHRVIYPKPIERPMTIDELYQWVTSLPGPRIVVLNTIQSAAALAKKISLEQGMNSVKHLSTAIAPIHRKDILSEILRLLKENIISDWTLVATTCAEAGLDFSFRTAARELGSLSSLIQIGGRVNRECEKARACEVWTFKIKEDGLLKTHPQFETPARILLQLFDENKVHSDFCTEAMKREIREKSTPMAKDDQIVKAEKQGGYEKVAELFKVIDEGEAFNVVIDPNFADKIGSGEIPSRREIQNNTVRMRKHHIDYLGLSMLAGHKELFFCPPQFYDEFLGYMKGILKIEQALPEDWLI